MEDVVRIGLPLGECVGLQHRQSWLRFPPNTDEEVHSCWAVLVHCILVSVSIKYWVGCGPGYQPFERVARQTLPGAVDRELPIT